MSKEVKKTAPEAEQQKVMTKYDRKMQKRKEEAEKAKKGLINAIVGFVLIFVLLIMLNIGTSVLTDWWNGYSNV